MEEYEEEIGKENKFQNEVAFLQKHTLQHSQQMETLQESTKMNLVKR